MRVHDSQAYRKMDVTRKPISHILELREILLSIQTGFSLVNAAVVCAILQSISGLEPSSVITEPRYFEVCDCLKLLSIYFDLFAGAACAVCHQLALLSTACHAVGFVETPQWGAADAEMKVPSGENTELKRSPFKAWSRSIYSHYCYAYCQGFLSFLLISTLPVHSPAFFPKPHPICPCVGCG